MTGGYVYRGPAFPDHGGDLRGTYLFADYQTNQFASFVYDPLTGQLGGFRDRTSEILGSLPAGVSLGGVASFAEDAAGNLYMLSLSSGDVFRIVPVPEPRDLLAAALAAAVAWRFRRRIRGEGGAGDGRIAD